MSDKDLQFICQKCGANALIYQKYAKCIIPVSMQENGHIEYGQSIIDEDDNLVALNGFACQSCGSLIEHCGVRMETEKQLIDYLTMEPDIREKEQQEYDEYVDDQSYDQEQKEKEQALCDWDITDLSGDN